MPSFSYLKWLEVKFRHVPLDIIFKPTNAIKGNDLFLSLG